MAPCIIRWPVTLVRCSGLPTRTASRRTCGRRARPICTTRTSASSISTRRRRTRTHFAAPRSRCAICSTSSVCRAGSRPPARRAFTSSSRWTARPTSVPSTVSRTPSARCSCRAIPKRLTQEFSKADRGGRILVDTGRNGYSATFAAPYAVRARAGAPISAPCTWEEVEKGDVEPQTFTIRTIADRIDAVGDLWADMRKHRYSLRTKIKRIKAEETTRRSS